MLTALIVALLPTNAVAVIDEPARMLTVVEMDVPDVMSTMYPADRDAVEVPSNRQTLLLLGATTQRDNVALVKSEVDKRVLELDIAPSCRNTSLLPVKVDDVEVIEYDDTVLMNRTSGAVPLAVLNVQPLINNAPELTEPVNTIASPLDMPVNTVLVSVTVNEENDPVIESPANVDDVNSSDNGDELMVTADELTQLEYEITASSVKGFVLVHEVLEATSTRRVVITSNENRKTGRGGNMRRRTFISSLCRLGYDPNKLESGQPYLQSIRYQEAEEVNYCSEHTTSVDATGKFVVWSKKNSCIQKHFSFPTAAPGLCHDEGKKGVQREFDACG
jgi:hypothetical protein